MRGKENKLKQEWFRLDIRKKNAPMRTVRQWHRLPREVMQSPSLEVFISNQLKPWSDLRAEPAVSTRLHQRPPELFPTL